MINVAVLGAAGRMGATVVRAVERADDLQLHAALDAGFDPAQLAGAHVAVDFTVPDAAEANVHTLIDQGIHAVVGTTGWTDDALDRVREHLAEAPGIGVLIAPNFAIGAVLAMRLSAMASKYFGPVETVELPIRTRSTRPPARPSTPPRASPQRGPRPASAPRPMRRRTTWAALEARSWTG